MRAGAAGDGWCRRHPSPRACSLAHGFLRGELIPMLASGRACPDVCARRRDGLAGGGPTQAAVEVDWPALPWLEGAADALGEGVLSSIHGQNARAAAAVDNFEQVRRRRCDPRGIVSRAFRLTRRAIRAVGGAWLVPHCLPVLRQERRAGRVRWRRHSWSQAPAFWLLRTPAAQAGAAVAVAHPGGPADGGRAAGRRAGGPSAGVRRGGTAGGRLRR